MPTQTNQPDVPPRAALERELLRLVHRRSAPRLDPRQALFGLALLNDRAGSEQPDAREAALAQLLPQIASRLSAPPEAEAVIRLLSLEGPLLRSSPGPRREAAGQVLGRIKGDSVRRRYERPLIADLARALVSAEVAFRRRSRDLDPDRIDWAGRLNSYGRIYAPIAGLAGDLEILIRAQRDRPSDVEMLKPQLGSSLWFYARIQLELHNFVRDYGGIWLFPDIEIENDVANAIHHINRHPGLNEHDTSWLRVTLRGIPDHELAGFLEAISSDPRGHAILKAWTTWCQSCQCPSIQVPERDCEIHAVIAACNDYLDDVDRETVTLAQPLRERLRDIPLENIRDLIKRFGAIRERRDNPDHMAAHPFDAAPDGHDIVEAWQRRLDECDCDLERPKQNWQGPSSDGRL